MPDTIGSGGQLAAAETREKKWDAYNGDLLMRMFTTDQYAWEYGSARVLVHQAADRYNDPSINTLAARLNESVRRQVAALESIIDRLGLIEEAPRGPATASSSATEIIRTKIFVVHGHDEAALQAVARFLEKLGLVRSLTPPAGRECRRQPCAAGTCRRRGCRERPRPRP